MASPRPITHPLAVAYLNASAEAHEATKSGLNNGVKAMAASRAGVAWVDAGCPLYADPPEVVDVVRACREVGDE